MSYYDEIASGYEELHAKEQLKKISIIKEHFSVYTTDKLLDVGCGTGLTTEPWDCRKYGVDPAPKLLARARHKDKIKYAEAAAEKLPFSDGFFDVVISITAIQNFSDIEKGLSEIKRVGKDRFVLTFLKKSAKRDDIDGLIRKMFSVSKVLEEDKDLIYFCGL
jgi:ubiquinone/menaquinone biosynthesis C-methylase UbiE